MISFWILVFEQVFKPEAEETPDQFVIRLKNNLAKWLELSGSSSGDFDALVNLIVKEQFINALKN